MTVNGQSLTTEYRSYGPTGYRTLKQFPSVVPVGPFLYTMQITLDLALFKGKKAYIGNRGIGRPQSQKALLWLLESMINIARIELKENRLPPLYKAGVIYVREETTEIWKDPITVYRDKEGDCEDLAIWRVAELRNNGKKARAYIRYRIHPQTGGYIYHVMVQRPNGLEDPSKILGMTGGD